jgi:dTDP-4-dehydrorhamnose 3,5-epimerase
MIFKESNLQKNYLIDLELCSDERGFFARYFCENEFQKHGLNTRWVQINNSMSNEAGTLRGLHFQRPPYSEVKLVRCLKGAIWDVVVDLRKGSKTIGKWFGSTLSEQNRTMMYVPEGFAHGFISLERNSEILYLVSNTYEPNSEETLIWNDPEVGIGWPMEPVIVSKKDMVGDFLKNITHIDLEN